MKKSFILTLFFISFLGNTQEIDTKNIEQRDGIFYEKGKEKPFTGKGITYFENGNKFISNVYKKGVINGKNEFWYMSGKKQVEVMIVNNYRNGILTAWYENGMKLTQGEYKNGKEEGEHIWWFENGNIKEKGSFSSGVKDGKWEKYHENGQKQSEGILKGKWKREGKWENWDENGKSIRTANYKGGVLIKANDINLKGLKTAISEILTLASKKNIKKLNEKYIYKDYGVYDIHRIGVPDRFKLLSEIPKKTKGWSIYHSLVRIENNQQKLVEDTIEFDCDKFVWNKEGLFYTKTITNPLLSQIMKYETENEGNKFSEEVIKKIQFIEKNSVRIIDTKSNLIFYLTNINDIWYITLVDRVTTDCSV